MAKNGLNNGNIKVYHVEADGTKEMTRVSSVAELNAHNQFTYDATEGTLTMSMASFSEVSVVSDTENAWNGQTEAFSKGTGTENDPYIIANADQLAYLSEMISKDNDDDNETNDYGSKHYKLNADINFEGSVFYPIGYHKLGSGANAAGETTWYTYGGSFSGTFDGNGHTISNIYQNTWSMDGNYDNGYWDEAMGLFGYVNGGTVKNLTMENFQSDGEFTPTGCVAAYATNSTFENIALVNCNPRVYNTGNGGIVGIGGNTSDPDTYKLTFNNITIDNSNKISALWGSWDVACGGLVGMFRGAGHVDMNNCHVAAQIDVYNDVCGNYQYYWYRYAGMLVGTNKNMVTDDDGYTRPDVSQYTATNCTVHFGDWNNYYYCELVENSLASYTHDHQFSRLEEISSVSEIQDAQGNWNQTGNFIIVEKNECYHIRKDAEGKFYRHNHADAGEETVNGKTVLKEDNQCIYLPFNQLFTGYGWGVKHIPVYNGKDYAFEGVTILDREEADSVVKFVSNGVTGVTTGESLTIGALFSEIPNLDSKVAIKSDNVQVSVSPVGDTSTASAVYTPNTTDWKQGTLTFSGVGAATISITDYYFCQTTTITITVAEPIVEAIDTFDVKFPNTDKYMYRVGNQNAVALGSLFATKAGVTVDGTKVDVKVESMLSDINSEYDALISEKKTDWASRTIQFKETGVVKVTICEEGNLPTTLVLEVVDAKNITTAESATANNVVLLNDCTTSSTFEIKNGYAFYGNGFTVKYSGNGSYGGRDLKRGAVIIETGGALYDTTVVAKIFAESYLYVAEFEKNAAYQLSAVAVSGDGSKVSNCYIYGARNNICIGAGDVVIENTVTECGSLANIHLYKSSSEDTVILNNVTTIQYMVQDEFGAGKNMLGFGVLVGDNENTSNPKIILQGDFKQYNWVTEADANNMSNDHAKTALNLALSKTDYQYTINGTKTANMGIVYLNGSDTYFDNSDNRANKAEIPYQLQTVSAIGYSGQVYSIKAGSSAITENSRYNAKTDGIIPYNFTVNTVYPPQLKLSKDTLGNQYEEDDGGDSYCYVEKGAIKIMFPSDIEGGKKTFDLLNAVDIQKYAGQTLVVSVLCKDDQGNNVVVTNGNVDFSETKDYIATYSVTDSVFTDKDGNIEEKSISYSWDVPIKVSKKIAIEDAYFEFDSSKQKIYCSGYSSYTQFIPFLAGLKIYDYDGTSETSYLRFDGDTDFNKIAKATINNVNTTGEAEGNHIVTVELTDGGKLTVDLDVRATSGGSTHTGSLKVGSNILYVVNDGTTSAKGQQWRVYNYKFIGNNGREISSKTTKGTILFGTNGTDATSGTKPSSNFGTTVKYTVTYNANGGNCGQSVGYATSVAAAVTLPYPIPPSDLIFEGWYTAASGGTRAGGAGDSYTPSANITLYAQWGKPCTVYYDANGGDCDISSEEYSKDALILSKPTRDGFWFIGWYDAPEGGNLIGDAGASYRPTGEITLYAHWQEAIEYTITYNTNGGNEIQEATYQGTALVLPTPTRTGYEFLGWYTAKSGGTKIGDAGASYIPPADITLYAQWEKIAYTIKVTTSNASITGVTNGQTAYYGDTISVTVSFSQNNSKTLTVKDASGNTVLSKSAAGTYDFTMPASNVTIEASSSGSCVTGDTLVTLADGSQKRIDEITYRDEVLVWNFRTGTYDSAPISLIINHGYDNQEIIRLIFNDGTTINFVACHGAFDKNLNEFVDINAKNVSQFIGDTFLKQSGNGFEDVVLVDYEVKTEYNSSYTLLSSVHYNAIHNGLLTVAPSVLAENLFDPFVVGDNMRFDEEKMQADIETYGLYTYEEFAEYVTEEQFEAWRIADMKVAVGKGYTSYEDIVTMLLAFALPNVN
ncbi:MAG: hypothetical protein E7397_04265 [Ruminococcaceae bacterium]|nr:hypothetical protein [Oscillospiraceae bacterium]